MHVCCLCNFVFKPRQFGFDYLSQSPKDTGGGPPSRPPKDVALSTVPMRPPKPPPYNPNYISENPPDIKDPPPIVPPRRRNSPALGSLSQGPLADPASGRPPVRPMSRATNEVVQETSLLGRVVSQPIAMSRSSPSRDVSEADDATPTGSPSQTKEMMFSGNDAVPTVRAALHNPVRLIFKFFFSFFFYARF